MLAREPSIELWCYSRRGLVFADFALSFITVAAALNRTVSFSSSRSGMTVETSPGSPRFAMALTADARTSHSLSDAQKA